MATQLTSRVPPYLCQSDIPEGYNPAKGRNCEQYDCTAGVIIGKGVISAPTEPVFSFILHQVDQALVDSVITGSAGINNHLNRPVPV